jgi:hypothetical protein
MGKSEVSGLLMLGSERDFIGKYEITLRGEGFE